MEIYQMTNIKTGEVYIGKNDYRNHNYNGSGVELKDRLSSSSKDDWFKTILCQVSSDGSKYNSNIILDIERVFIQSAINSLGSDKVLNIIHNPVKLVKRKPSVSFRLKRAIIFRRNGWSNVKIAKHFGVSEGAVRKWWGKLERIN